MDITLVDGNFDDKKAATPITAGLELHKDTNGAVFAKDTATNKYYAAKVDNNAGKVTFDSTAESTPTGATTKVDSIKRILQRLLLVLLMVNPLSNILKMVKRH